MENSVVYLVCGQDDEARESVVAVLDRLGLGIGIFQDMSDGCGATIELIQPPPGSVDYVIVLLTPDDVGARLGQALRPRARQSVVLGLGFFVASVGSSRVCALVKGDVERPVEGLGVRYHDMDDEGLWRLRLAYDMKEAGLSVDVYRLLA